MNLKRIILYCIPFFIHSFTANAILDGSSGNFPILLDTTYSFSNFEWAKGYVKFNNGFDIATNETAILDINQEINGQIAIGTRGTLILKRDLVLGDGATLASGGGGYIITNGHTIFFKGNLSINVGIYLVGAISFDGMGMGRLSIGGANSIIATTNNNISFSNLQLFVSSNPLCNNFIPFSTASPISLTLNNVVWNSSGLACTTVNQLTISGNCRISGNKNHYYTNSINLNPLSTLYLDFSNTLETDSALSLGSQSTFIMESSTLIVTRLLATGSFIKWIIKGKSVVKAGGTSPLIYVSSSITTILDIGARLAVEPNTHLVFN